MAHEFGNVHLAVVEQRKAGVQDLSQVVRRDIGRETDRDTTRRIANRRDASGEIFWFNNLRILLVRGLQGHGLTVDITQHEFAKCRQPHFGVPIGSGRVIIDRSEVALTLYERIPERKLLRHPHGGVIHRGIAVRVIVT